MERFKLVKAVTLLTSPPGIVPAVYVSYSPGAVVYGQKATQQQIDTNVSMEGATLSPGDYYMIQDTYSAINQRFLTPAPDTSVVSSNGSNILYWIGGGIAVGLLYRYYKNSK